MSHHPSHEELVIDDNTDHHKDHHHLSGVATQQEYLHYGDFISLYTESSGGGIGFLSVDGININCKNIQGFVYNLLLLLNNNNRH